MSLRERGYIMEAAADTTLKQLGGSGRLKAMIGAKDFMSDDGGKTLMFKFPNRGAGKPNYVKITLTSADLYDIQFGRITNKKAAGPALKKLKSYDGIYADQLKSIFEKETGLRLSL